MFEEVNVEEVLRKYGDGGRKVAGAGKMRGGGRAGFRPRRMVPGEGAGVTHLLLRILGCDVQGRMQPKGSRGAVCPLNVYTMKP